MHNAAFAALGLNWRYFAFEVHPNDLSAAIEGARVMGFAGLNLTVPHKLPALKLMDALDKSAKKWGAVNTIRFESASVKERAKVRAVGFNTDADAIPAAVREQVGNGAVIVDVREPEEWSAGHIPGAIHVPKSYLESRIEGAVPDHEKHVVLYCASGNRSVWAARTLIDDLGYEHVESMTGGFTLWKDRGYEVETPRALTAEQRERYSRLLLLPEVGPDGQQKLLDARVLLLGAGGAGRTAALKLAAEKVAELFLVNRTSARARTVASELKRLFPSTRVTLGYPTSDVDLLINATSLGLKSGDASPVDGKQFALKQARTVYDMIYRPAETPLLKAARKAGCRAANGLGMLLHQGAKAFEIWTGKTAPLDVMHRALEQNIYGH